MAVKVGSIFKQLLAEKRMSIKEVAEASGVPASTLSEWLNNRTPKNPQQARDVARALGVSLHYLLFGEEDTEEPLHKLLKEDVFSGTFEINIRRIRISKK